jgi:hypothetical protein
MNRVVTALAGLATAGLLLAPITASAAPLAATATPLPCRASVSNSNPKDYSDVYVNVSTTARSSVTTTAHYKTTSTRHTATANSHGTASIRYSISRATPGYKVVVSVQVKLGSRSGSCSTSFTPHR